MNDVIVLKLDKARQLLTEAKDAQTVKQVVDLARAAEVYARRQKLSQESIDYAHAVKIDAMTLLGEMLKLAPKNKGESGSKPKVTGSLREPVKDPAPTLADIGIDKKESAAAQMLATLKEEDEELYEMVRTGKRTMPQARRALERQHKEAEERLTYPIIPTQVPGESLSFRDEGGRLVLCLERRTEVYGLQLTACILTPEAEAALLDVLLKRKEK